MPAELLQGRWARVNFRICSMLMAAAPESIKADIVARKCNQSAPSILFRFHTTYQPGGGSEKEVIQKNLMQPTPESDPSSAVKSLREWIPLVQSLVKVATCHLRTRPFCPRASLRLLAKFWHSMKKQSFERSCFVPC